MMSDPVSIVAMVCVTLVLLKILSLGGRKK